MHYVVMDLEWNQAMSSKSSVFNKLPIHLRGEIIEIGAVKLNEDMTPGEEFQIDVKPMYFKRMHYKVKKLTGFDRERLAAGVSFPEALAQFRAWCGDDVTFLTWGCDDQGILEQNIIIHDLDWDWIAGWINLQLIYNLQTDGDRNQKSLATAMEHFAIEQTRIAHDALGDAYNTALVCSKLDFAEGLEQYDNATSLLATRLPEDKHHTDEPDALEHRAFTGYNSRSEAFLDEEVTSAVCPDCGEPLELTRWVNQGDRRYMTIGTCEEHRKFLVRLKFRKTENDSWSVNRIVYRADDEMEKFYRDKATQSRRRGRGHRRRRSENT